MVLIGSRRKPNSDLDGNISGQPSRSEGSRLYGHDIHRRDHHQKIFIIGETCASHRLLSPMEASQQGTSDGNRITTSTQRHYQNGSTSVFSRRIDLPVENSECSTQEQIKETEPVPRQGWVVTGRR